MFTDKILPVLKELLSVLIKAAVGLIIQKIITRFSEMSSEEQG